jgi:hypothetical protein
MNKYILLFIISICLVSTCYGQTWPKITPVSGEVVFTDADNATFAVNITDIHNKNIPMSCNDIQDVEIMLLESRKLAKDKDFIRALFLLDKGLNFISDSYYSSGIVDDTGLKLTLAENYQKQNDLQRATVIKDRMLNTRLELFREKFNCK